MSEQGKSTAERSLRRLSVGSVLEVHGQLEPAQLVQSLRDLCASHGLDIELRIFATRENDPAHLSSFGEDGQEKTYDLPRPEQAPGPLAPLEPPADGRFSWCGFFPVQVAGVPVALLQVCAPRALEDAEIELLAEICSVMSGAIRNAILFEKTKRLTFTDDLTALYNSRFMSLYLDRELKRCRRMRSSLSLLFMDLDGFKAINDTHGHLAGSRTLVEVGAALEKTVRDADVVIRYGGDEFVILFPETPLSGGLVIAERIRQVIGASRFLASMDLDARVSASIGLAAYPESADDVRTLIACADQAMYKAKALGKNRVVVAPAPGPTQQ